MVGADGRLAKEKPKDPSLGPPLPFTESKVKSQMEALYHMAICLNI